MDLVLPCYGRDVSLDDSDLDFGQTFNESNILTVA